MRRRRRLGLALAAGPLALVPLAALAGGAAAPGADVTVTVKNLRNAKGLVRACMTTAPRAFPACEKDPAAHTASIDAAGAAHGISFRGVRPGTYAIALLHDENANGKADFALGMMPKEGFGFSRDARVRMGPPKFAEAAIAVGEEDRALAITMRYIF